jgi:hypothetical protein
MLLAVGRTGNLTAVYWFLEILPRALGGDPLEERAHAGAFAPHQAKERGAIEVRRVFAKVSFKAPLKVRRRPGPQPIPLRSDPVIAQRVQHARGSRRCADARIVG